MPAQPIRSTALHTIPGHHQVPLLSEPGDCQVCNNAAALIQPLRIDISANGLGDGVGADSLEDPLGAGALDDELRHERLVDDADLLSHGEMLDPVVFE